MVTCGADLPRTRKQSEKQWSLYFPGTVLEAWCSPHSDGGTVGLGVEVSFGSEPSYPVGGDFSATTL